MPTKDIADDRVGVREASRREASRSCNVPQERAASIQQNRQLTDQIRTNLCYFCCSGYTAIDCKTMSRPRQTHQKLNNKGISVAIKRFQML
jgi:hypothetical protein